MKTAKTTNESGPAPRLGSISTAPLRMEGDAKGTVSMSFPYDLEVIRYTPVIH